MSELGEVAYPSDILPSSAYFDKQRILLPWVPCHSSMHVVRKRGAIMLLLSSLHHNQTPSCKRLTPVIVAEPMPSLALGVPCA